MAAPSAIFGAPPFHARAGCSSTPRATWPPSCTPIIRMARAWRTLAPSSSARACPHVRRCLGGGGQDLDATVIYLTAPCTLLPLQIRSWRWAPTPGSAACGGSCTARCCFLAASAPWYAHECACLLLMPRSVDQLTFLPQTFTYFTMPFLSDPRRARPSFATRASAPERWM